MKKIMVSLGLVVCISAPAAASQKLNGRIVISNDETSVRAVRHTNGRQKELLKVGTSKKRNHASKKSNHARTARLDSRVPKHLAPIIEEASRHHGVDPRLVAAVCRRESRFRVNAVSPVGAQGVMQLMPATAKWLGVENAFDPRQNIFAGTKYLRMLLDQFDGNVRLSLAAYNAGPGAVRKHRGIPPYRETRQYVAAIQSDYQSSLR